MSTMANFATLSAEEQERLQKFLPVRAVIRRHSDGTLEGLTEESWNRWLNARHKYDKRNAYFVIQGETP